MIEMFNTEEIVKIIEEVIKTKIIDYSINPFNHGLDSLGVLKLITILEERLSIEIDDNDLTVENMSSVNSILNIVNKYDNE
jgi:acyl carrier protein